MSHRDKDQQGPWNTLIKKQIVGLCDAYKKNDAEAEPLSLKSTEEKTEIKEIKHIPKTKMVDGAVIKNITDTKTFALSVRIKLKAVWDIQSSDFQHDVWR